MTSSPEQIAVADSTNVMMSETTGFATRSRQEDDWHGVLDRKKRKQIQDRLAQRARRRRLAEARPSENASAWKTTRSKQRSRIRKDNPSPSASSDVGTRGNASTISTLQPSLEGLYSCRPVSASEGQTFLSALFENGNILGIACGASFPSKSKLAGPDVPPSLRPTLLQLSTVHWQWIDRLPFPEARDEIIIQSSNFNEEEFLWDIFNMPTFTLTPGLRAWDPNAYRMHPQFKSKWGFLFPNFT
ncbi:uncharacterized protein PV09_02492 [Verruconis gallopava]|uniref:BZIP domain-containing protein n=1 Tax=Verruconis gallopava TaxID=253628 RepID=A0A0D1Z1J8_9PEZI|nr:uncharacterized protein PV09_02492 [Verruconis gallopava]KIW06812.1 hypothetical protein PV09_02492 [Verruconis gallopava]